MIDGIINHEQPSIIKGPRYQKLRAVDSLLEVLINDEKKYVYCTTEYKDDFFKLETDEFNAIKTIEQDKEYSSNFSIADEEIKKSLCIFLDIWLNYERDSNLYFAFMTPASWKKEGPSKITKANKLKLPNEPILRLLSEKREHECLNIIKIHITDYYKYMYKDKKSDSYIELINKLDDKEWLTFLRNINWRFNERNVSDLDINLKEKIELLCNKFNIDKKYSNLLLDHLKETVEKKSLNNGFLNRVVSIADVENIFLRIKTTMEIEVKIDPVYELFNKLETSDKRDLREKIMKVCLEYPEIDLDEYEEDLLLGEFILNKEPCQQAVKSYMYRIYIKAKRLIKRELNAKSSILFQREEIDSLIDSIIEECYESLIDNSKTYKVPFKDKETLRNTLLLLFNECYLALD